MSNAPSPTEKDLPDAFAAEAAAPLRSRWNLPNALCGARLAGTPFMLYFAYEGWRTEFLVLFVSLLLTDWLDGKLAIMLDQRTPFGARLDSVADAVLLGGLIVSVWLLAPEAVRSEWIGIISVLASFTISILFSVVKFGRPPSYHTWSAKIAWWLVAIGALLIFWDGSLWTIRIALFGVVLSNVEAMLITLALTEWRADVRSVFLVVSKHRS